MHPIPRWADVVLIPLISVLFAAICAGLLLLAIGEDPIAAMNLMIEGTLFRSEGIGFMIYYTTNFIFTGLAVSVAFHAALFNIGGEGQAQLGGLGVAMALLFIPWPHWTLAILAASLGAMAFGAVWAAIPAYLQAKRGSHIVITTIMFNFIAAALMNYLLVNTLKPAGQMDPATPSFAEATHLPTFRDMAEGLGFDRMFGASPANVSTFLAIIAAVLVWVLIWRTRLGFEIRSFGKSPTAAKYAGISPTKIIMIAMIISGGLAGMMAVNTTQGEAERLILNFTEGAGFLGIAVALMGRSHPFGVCIAALLFGFLFQGGAELGFWTSIPRELILVIQALVILFVGALDNMVRMFVGNVFRVLKVGG